MTKSQANVDLLLRKSPHFSEHFGLVWFDLACLNYKQYSTAHHPKGVITTKTSDYQKGEHLSNTYPLCPRTKRRSAVPDNPFQPETCR